MKPSGSKIQSITAGGGRSNPNSIEAVLRDLAGLLEEYGPSWYTESQHRRVQAALGRDTFRHSGTTASTSR